jgi:hypothetical protein
MFILLHILNLIDSLLTFYFTIFALFCLTFFNLKFHFSSYRQFIFLVYLNQLNIKGFRYMKEIKTIIFTFFIYIRFQYMFLNFY